MSAADMEEMGAWFLRGSETPQVFICTLSLYRRMQKLSRPEVKRSLPRRFFPRRSHRDASRFLFSSERFGVDLR